MKEASHATPSPFSASEFLALGVQGIAYVRPALVEGEQRLVVHGANGVALAVASDMDAVFQVLRARKLDLVALH